MENDFQSRPWQRKYDPGVPVSLSYPKIPLYAFLQQSAQKYPHHPCIIYQNCSLSYSRVDDLTDRLALNLIKIGIKKGEPVAICLPNIPQFVLAYYAILKAGAVVTALNPQYKLHELEYHLQDAGARLVFCLPELYPTLCVLKQNTEVTRIVVTQMEDFSVGGMDGEMPSSRQIELERDDLWLDALLDESCSGTLPFVMPEDRAIFQYSGGTTGVPKAAVGLHKNLVANTLQFRNWLVGMEEGREVVLAVIPLFHVYGMVIALNLGILLGASIVLEPDARDMSRLLYLISRYCITLLPGVPNIYQKITYHPEVKKGNCSLHTIKACISGSAPLFPETKREFERLTGGKLMEGYGLSETPTATHCNPMYSENKPGSIGLPLPDVDCRIVDLEEGGDLPPGGIGELRIRGPQVMWGYHNQPEETECAIKDGWLCTGDVAYMDDDGYFYLVDRKKDLIKVGGFQVWPKEVEEVLCLHPDVAEAGVAGVIEKERGEVVRAWVVLKQSRQGVSPEEIKSWCEKHLAWYKIPTRIYFVEALPRNVMGKILRRVLREMV